MEAKTKKQMQPLFREVCGEIDEHERAAASKAKNGHLKKRPYLRIRWGVRNLSHFLELFQHMLCHFLTLCCTQLTILKAHATPTNSNAHVSPVSSKVIVMHLRHTAPICTPSHVIWTINVQQRRTLQQSRTSHRSAWESENCAQHQLQAPASQVYTRQQQGSS